jgi:hypothetical protein
VRRLLPTAFTVACICLAVANLRVHFPNRDVSWYVYLGQHVATGVRLNVDLFEINPPFIVWVTTAVARLAGALHAAPIAAYEVCVALLLGASTLLTARLVRLSVWGVAVVTVALWLVPGGDFGQREHLMVALMCPYAGVLVRRLEDDAPRSWQIGVAGLLAGLGICFKPHFAVVWAGMELAAWRDGLRWCRRTEFLAVAAVQLGYVLAIIPSLPAYLSVVREFGPAYQTFWHVQPWALVLFEPSSFLVVAALGLAAIHYRVLPPGCRARVRIFGSLTAASWVVAIVQAKGWPYHFYPPTAFAVVLLFFTAAGVLSGERSSTGTSAVAGGLVLGLAIGAAVGPVVDEAVRLMEASPGARLVAAVRQASRPGERIVVFNFGMQAAFPTIPLAGLESASRWPTQWMLMAAYPVPQPWHTPETMPGFERSYFASTLADLTARPPELLVAPIPDPRAATLRGFDFLGYFAQDERFARLLARYDLATTVSGHRIFRRRDAPWRPDSLPADLGGTFDEVSAGSDRPTRTRPWQLVLVALVVTATGWTAWRDRQLYRTAPTD